MNCFSRTIVTLSLLFLSNNLFAATEQEEIDCPTISTIANVKFKKAKLFWPGDNTLWAMISNNFNYHGNEWNVSYVVRLLNAKTPTEALDQGQAYFNNGVVLSNPTYPAPHGYLSCEYAHADDGYNGYIVQANSPATDFPNMNFK